VATTRSGARRELQQAFLKFLRSLPQIIRPHNIQRLGAGIDILAQINGRHFTLSIPWPGNDSMVSTLKDDRVPAGRVTGDRILGVFMSVTGTSKLMTNNDRMPSRTTCHSTDKSIVC